MNQFKILADFVNLYLQEVLIELSKVGKLCSEAGEVALDLTLSANKLPQNQSKDKSQSQRQSQWKIQRQIHFETDDIGDKVDYMY